MKLKEMRWLGWDGMARSDHELIDEQGLIDIRLPPDATFELRSTPRAVPPGAPSPSLGLGRRKKRVHSRNGRAPGLCWGFLGFVTAFLGGLVLGFVTLKVAV